MSKPITTARPFPSTQCSHLKKGTLPLVWKWLQFHAEGRQALAPIGQTLRDPCRHLANLTVQSLLSDQCHAHVQGCKLRTRVAARFLPGSSLHLTPGLRVLAGGTISNDGVRRKRIEKVDARLSRRADRLPRHTSVPPPPASGMPPFLRDTTSRGGRWGETGYSAFLGKWMSHGISSRQFLFLAYTIYSA